MPSGKQEPVVQGTADRLLAEELNPEIFAAACRRSGLPFELRLHAGYDHGYYFIQTFMEEHLRWHVRQLHDDHMPLPGR